MIDFNQRVYPVEREGRRAYDRGLRLGDCPYICDCPERTLWVLGWTKAKIEEQELKNGEV